MDKEEILNFMHFLCDEAAKKSLGYFNDPNLKVSNKDDIGFDPVTNADIDCEKIIVDHIRNRFPDHGIISEEENNKADKGKPHWVIDPIDGTRAFILGIPSWGTLICFNDGKKPFIGMLDKPSMKERYFSDGINSYIRKGNVISQIKTSDKEELNTVTLSSTDPYLFKDKEENKFRNLVDNVNLSRWGLDCSAYGLLASGSVDLVVENNLNPYDIQALIPIIKGAGGIIATWEGNEPSDGGSIIAACNETIYNQAIKILKE